MLSPKEQKRLKSYEENLVMSKWKLILVYGLPFGIISFILTTSYEYFFDKSNFHWDIGLLFKAIIMITIGGFLYGWIMRKFMKWDYKKLKSKAS